MSGIDILTSGEHEPFGHSGPTSKLERYWAAQKGCMSLGRVRGLAYDPRASMTYRPMRYETAVAQIKPEQPSDEWIANTFVEFVKVEFSERTRAAERAVPQSPMIANERTVPDTYLDAFLLSSESIDSIAAPRVDPHWSPAQMASAVYDLLCHRDIGSADNARNNERASFVERLSPTIEAQSRLLFVIPGFPFKDQNMFRVPYAADEPDLADVAFMIRLHNLTQALYQVHPYGADVIVLTDGRLYRDLFGVDATIVERYHQRLLSYRNRLNLQGTVSFVPLDELIDRTPIDGATPGARAVASRIARRLESLVDSGPSGVASAFAALISGMKWNMESRLRLAGIERGSCWSILRGNRDEVDGANRHLWEEVHTRATGAAIQYAAVNLMLRWLDLVSVYFPGSIRGTVHPKRGQFALARSAGAYAWNGVAWSNRLPKHINEVEVKPFFATDDGRGITAVRFDSGLPCCFVREYS